MDVMIGRISMMTPGKTYRLRSQGKRDYVNGYFRNGVFYEGGYSPLRVGFIDPQSGFFYRHTLCASEQYFRVELSGRVAGLTLTSVNGGVYYLTEVQDLTGRKAKNSGRVDHQVV